MKDKIIHWIFTGESGLSSECMAATACGIKLKNKNHPRDPSDLIRCIKLVRHVCEIEDKFKEISKISKEWECVINNWELLLKALFDEVGYDFKKSNKAPKTYLLMKNLGL